MTAQDGRDGSFRRIVERAIYGLHVEQGYVAPKDGKRIAAVILQQLHGRGLAIHDPANCVRRPWQDRARVKIENDPPHEPLGRVPSVEEQIRLGMVAVSDEVP